MQNGSDDTSTLTMALAPTVGADPGSRGQDPDALAAYLQRSLGRPVRVIVEASYAATVESLRAGRVDVAMVGELASLRGQEIGGVEPLVVPVQADGQIPTYQSVIVTRIDSGIHDLAALRGTTIGLVDEQSTSGYLVPRAMLREAGIDPDTEVGVRLYGRHRAVVEAVLAGEVVAGATHASRLRPPTLDQGAEYARLRVVASSRPIPRGPLVVRADLSPTTRQALAEALLAGPRGRRRRRGRAERPGGASGSRTRRAARCRRSRASRRWRACRTRRSRGRSTARGTWHRRRRRGSPRS